MVMPRMDGPLEEDPERYARVIAQRYGLDFHGMPEPVVSFCREAEFTWPAVCEHFRAMGESMVRKGKKVDLGEAYLQFPSWAPAAQRRALAVMVGFKMELECTRLFQKPMQMELECLGGHAKMNVVKKFYRYKFYEPDQPLDAKKLKSVGTVDVKRAWCMWCRQTLSELGKLVGLPESEMYTRGVAIVEASLRALVEDRVPLEALVLTRSYKHGSYKSDRQAHVFVGQAYEAARRCVAPDTFRVAYVYVEVPAGVMDYQSVVTEDIFRQGGYKLDKVYYLAKQFLKPVSAELGLCPRLLYTVREMCLLQVQQLDGIRHGIRSLAQLTKV